MNRFFNIKAIAIVCYCLVFHLFATARTPKNVILMIGDGMGLSQIYAALTANGGSLNMERCPYSGFSKTYTYNDYITDSAAGATALACGVKTRSGMVGMSADSVSVPSIFEQASAYKKATGIVVSCSITHATPAGFYAHQDSRKKEENIAEDLVSSPIDVFIGGGKKFFDKRTDNKNLLSNLRQQGFLIKPNLDSVKSDSISKMAVFLAEEHLPTAMQGRAGMLAEASLAAINVLNKNKQGFFLMVEGSQIDFFCHKNDKTNMIAETIDFDNAVGAVLDFAQKDGNTLVIITADHETGGLTIMDGDISKNQVDTQFNKTGHTGVMVPVFSYGPGADKFSGIQQNIDIPIKIRLLSGFTK